MLTFTAHNNHYNAIGVYGTHYTIVEDKGYFYPEHDNTEYDNLAAAIAHCNLCEECECLTVSLVNKGLKAYMYDGSVADFVHSIDDVYYVYCPNAEIAKLFCDWTEKATDAYQLDRVTKYSEDGGPCLYIANGYEYEEMDKALAWIIADNK